MIYAISVAIALIATVVAMVAAIVSIGHVIIHVFGLKDTNAAAGLACILYILFAWGVYEVVRRTT